MGISEIGNIISEHRKEIGMTQDALAEALNITPQAISKWENGVSYPDISMIPLIAETLNIPIGMLFGEKKEVGTNEPPKMFGSLPLITTDGNSAVYSDKKVEQIENGKVTFADGSVADILKCVAENTGKGEIRIMSLDDERMRYQSVNAEPEMCPRKTFTGIDSLNLSLSYPCSVTVEKGEAGNCTVDAIGTDNFISHFYAEQAGAMLSVKTTPVNHADRGCKINIRVPFNEGNNFAVNIQGSSTLECKTDFKSGKLSVAGSGSISSLNFSDAELSVAGSGEIYIGNIAGAVKASVAGSGEIKFGSAGIADTNIAGSGDISCGEISEKMKLTISGSGDADCKSANNADIRITGSGDADISTVSGDLRVSISGSGDVKCAGEVGTLTLNIEGSGDFNGNSLTVDKADIIAKGSSDIVIDRIKNGSTEHLSKGATLVVNTRG